MKAELDRLMTETGRDAPAPQAADLDKETMERLTALGYVGAPVSARKASGASGPLADPKDKIGVFMAVTRAGELVLEEKYAEAVAALESALREEPTIPQALALLSTCYVELGRPEEAKAKLDILLKEDPESVQGLISLANILLDEGKTDDVIALCKRTLSVDDKNTQAYTLIGEVYLEQGNYVEALPYLEKAVETQPKITRTRLTLAAALVGAKQYDRAESELAAVIGGIPEIPLGPLQPGPALRGAGPARGGPGGLCGRGRGLPPGLQGPVQPGPDPLPLGDKPGSLAQMKEVVRIAPKLAEGHLMLARGLLDAGDPLDERPGRGRDGAVAGRDPRAQGPRLFPAGRHL